MSLDQMYEKMPSGWKAIHHLQKLVWATNEGISFSILSNFMMEIPFRTIGRVMTVNPQYASQDQQRNADHNRLIRKTSISSHLDQRQGDSFLK